METNFRGLFEYSPIALWEQDFSRLKQALDALRAGGISDLRAYLADHPVFTAQAMGLIASLDMNERTIRLYAAGSKQEILDNLPRLFRDEMSGIFREELLTIWQDGLEFESEGVNYTLTGDPIQIFLRWRVYPGYEQTYARVLVSLEDITARKRAEAERDRALAALRASEAHFRGLFENSPISIWLEDFSGVKTCLDQLRSQGVEDLEEYLKSEPDLIDRCMHKIRVLDVNRKTLEIYGAQSKEEIVANLGSILRDDIRFMMIDELLMIWQGRPGIECEGINYRVSGEKIDVAMQLSVMPGSEATYDRVLVSISDISARKRAEEYLKYLGTHDILTGLYNRAYYEEELERLEKSRRYPISIMVADIDDMKTVNDTKGHAAGDDLLRRTSELLKAGFRGEDVVARIGGDEFAVILPETDEKSAQQALERIRNLLIYNNSYYQGPLLSLSMGVATAQKGERLEAVMQLADKAMYANKRRQKRQH